jgi:hypothetical protein
MSKWNFVAMGQVGLTGDQGSRSRPARDRILEGDDPSIVPSGRWNMLRHEVEWCLDDG